MKERLQKVLSQAGLGSRRYCEQLITSGRVQVDGNIVKELGFKVDPEKQKIYCDGQLVRLEPKLYFLLNKPKGYICTTNAAEGKRVIDLFKHIPYRLFTIGRLDKDSEGLLIVTNDGELSHYLTHPRYEVPKTYRVTVRGYVEGEVLEKIQRGVWLSEGKTSGMRVRILLRTRNFTAMEVTLIEGKNREIRRVFAKFGHPIKYLQRIRIGKLSLSGLKPGQYKPISKKTLWEAIKS